MRPRCLLGPPSDNEDCNLPQVGPHIHSPQFLGLILEGLVFGDFLALLVMCDKDNFSVSLKNPHFF